jgi:hypothetical protein
MFLICTSPIWMPLVFIIIAVIWEAMTTKPFTGDFSALIPGGDDVIRER